MPRQALCVGVNYANTEFELRGCVNDANDWAQFFDKRGFSTSVLTENQATRQNMLAAMESLVRQLQPGEIGAIQFSGHGTWLPDRDGDEPDGRDEALVPHDVTDDGRGLIIDDELRVIFGRLREGARLLWISDCCHSGTAFRFFGNGASKRRVRFLPPSHFLVDTGLVRRMERAYGQPPKRTNAALPGVLHLSGCRDHEYSADAEIDGRFSGALSYYALLAFKQVVQQKGTYQDVHKLVRQYLPSWDFQQTPQLNGATALKRTPLF